MAKLIQEQDGSEALTILIDEKPALSFRDGEPEDNNLLRGFADCHRIPDVLRQAWEAGRRGEPFITQPDTVVAPPALSPSLEDTRTLEALRAVLHDPGNG